MEVKVYRALAILLLSIIAVHSLLQVWRYLTEDPAPAQTTVVCPVGTVQIVKVGESWACLDADNAA